MKHLVFYVFACLVLCACSGTTEESNSTEVDKVKSVVEEYIASNFKEGQVELEAIEIDTISPKEKLETESMDLVKEVTRLINEASQMQKQLEDKKASKPSSASDLEMYESSLKQLQDRLLKNQEETRIKLTLAKELQVRSKKADSLSISYLNVTAKTTMKDKGNTKVLLLPFYISSDGKILRKPSELMGL